MITGDDGNLAGEEVVKFRVLDSIAIPADNVWKEGREDVVFFEDAAVAEKVPD